jgi:DNA polymerase-3 subunit epsilon
MREIVLDTETTGLDPFTGDRIVEIGALELINHLPSGETFHHYINPERDMPTEAFAVHGLSEEFLSDKQVFAEVAELFEEFIGDDTLIIHNASFDIKFLNAELKMVNRPALQFSRVIDTLALARKKHPAGPNSLDALCRRYRIDNSMREIHGALLDSELLAGVYLELIGGRQTTFTLATEEAKTQKTTIVKQIAAKPRTIPLPSRLTSQEISEHKKHLGTLKGDILWAKYLDK